MRQIPVHAAGLTALVDVSYPPCIATNYRLCEFFDECVAAEEALGNAEACGDDSWIDEARNRADAARARLASQVWAHGGTSLDDLHRIVEDLHTVQRLARLDAEIWDETRQREARRHPR